jgi:multidrug efflux pump subunit AcrA (membrane-fusion protein)
MMPASVSSAILRAALTPYARYDRGLDEVLQTLPETQGQLQQVGQQMNQLQQQLGQAQQGLQYWQSVATQLQQAATAATAAQKTADAGKKRAEEQKILSSVPDEKIQPAKTVAEVRNLDAQTEQIRKEGWQTGGQPG